MKTIISLILLVSYACCRDVPVKHAPTVRPADLRLYWFIGDIEITNAIAQTKYPKTLAAIAKVESGFKKDAIGDGGESYGLYQIQQKHFGKVPTDVAGQTRKAEAILDDLVRRRGYYAALAEYNGEGPAAKRYREKVLKVIKSI